MTAICRGFTIEAPEGWPLLQLRAAADVTAGCPRGGCRGRSARRRRRAPEGQRKAAGASARRGPGEASQLRADAAPPAVSCAVARRFQDQRAAPARRAPRALEVVLKVLTRSGGNSGNSQGAKVGITRGACKRSVQEECAGTDHRIRTASKARQVRLGKRRVRHRQGTQHAKRAFPSGSPARVKRATSTPKVSPSLARRSAAVCRSTSRSPAKPRSNTSRRRCSQDPAQPDHH